MQYLKLIIEDCENIEDAAKDAISRLGDNHDDRVILKSKYYSFLPYHEITRQLDGGIFVRTYFNGNLQYEGDEVQWLIDIRKDMELERSN